MLEDLGRIIEEVSGLNSKLVLVIGGHQTGKSKLLGKLAEYKQMRVLSVGVGLGHKLLAVPVTRRHLHVAEMLTELSNDFADDGLLIMDNIEILFDQRLMVSPLELLKRQAHVRRVVAAWPGELRDGRLFYATPGHPEYRDYGVDGLVPLTTIERGSRNANTLLGSHSV
ncbi:MAG: BREX-3 system P-loop-containing protein BrxF [Aquidulcibacter sp.]|nr:BREX-3 system P-loop-containing protein BrxF [Aquidulcibacter sp.]